MGGMEAAPCPSLSHAVLGEDLGLEGLDLWQGEIGGWYCPLTDLENSLRRAAGQAGYPGGFIEHYLLPIVYPAGLTREMQIGFALLVIGINLSVYG